MTAIGSGSLFRAHTIGFAQPNELPPASPEASRLGGGGPAAPRPSDPYGLPPGATLGQTAGGKQAQPFDVTLSKLATAVYGGNRPAPPEPWKAVTDDDLRARGIDEPAAWRAKYLGGDTQTEAQHFKAEIYTDGDGNYVLAYRGTDGTAADWGNNFKQGTGFSTGDVDKFSGMAQRTALQFAQHFGDGGNPPSNLAITGHSQGGGLATVGSIVSGIPAVTFDASGVHPNTWDRLGIDPQKARETAEGGTIRAYSLKDDLLTQAQESGPTGLLAPDALGTKIVVQPSGKQDISTIPRGLDIETGLPKPLTGPLGGALEIAHRVPVPVLAGVGGVAGFMLGGPLGGLVGGGIGAAVGGAGDLTRAAVSHSPELLTDAMIQQQPWQEGYKNPFDAGKALQNLLPDVFKDDLARNTHEVAAGIVDVTQTDFKEGHYVQGGFRIAGDIGEGVVDSAGDTARRGADAVARAVDERIDGPVGDVLSSAISTGGGFLRTLARATGDGVEKVADFTGKVAQKGVDAAGKVAGWLFGR